MKTERTQIHFLRDVLVTVVSPYSLKNETILVLQNVQFESLLLSVMTKTAWHCFYPTSAKMASIVNKVYNRERPNDRSRMFLTLIHPNSQTWLEEFATIHSIKHWYHIAVFNKKSDSAIALWLDHKSHAILSTNQGKDQKQSARVFPRFSLPASCT